MKLRKGKVEIPEKDVLQGCLEYLTAIGAFVWRVNTGGALLKGGFHVRFGFPGVADIIGTLPDGRFIACECKRVGKDPSPAQVKFGLSVTGRKGIYIVAHSVEELREELRKVGA